MWMQHISKGLEPLAHPHLSTLSFLHVVVHNCRCPVRMYTILGCTVLAFEDKTIFAPEITYLLEDQEFQKNPGCVHANVVVRLPSDPLQKFHFPVQFLDLGIEVTIISRELIHLLLQILDVDDGNILDLVS